MTTAIHLTKKMFTTAVVVMTGLWSVGAAALINPLIARSAAVALSSLVSGDLVMTDGAAAGATVYLYSSSKKYPFPNQKVYASWYGNDFSKVKRISATDMGSIAWGDNMLYRPGSRLIKVPDDPKVYAVLPKGEVAWVKDEATAVKFYGSAWAGRVDDLLASLFVSSYTNNPSKDLTASSTYPDGTLVKVGTVDGALSAAAVKYYYLEAGKKREVSDAALAQFRMDFVLTVSETDIVSFAVGVAVGTGEFLNPVQTQEGTTVPGAEKPVDSSPAGALTVSLASDSPSARVFDGTALNPVLKLDLKAGSNAVKIKSLKLTKRGGATNSNITGIRVVDGKGVRHGNVLSSINEDNTFTLEFSSAPIEVPANGSETATVQLDFNTSNNGVDLGLSVAAAGDVGTENASVSGSFPLTGFLIDVKDGNGIVTTVTYDLDDTASTSSIQMNVASEVLKFTLRETGSNEKVWFKKIDLYNNGSVADGDVKDFQLLGPNGDVLQTVQQKDKHIVFDLGDTPFSMDKGATKSFKVKATPISGATRSLDLQLQNNYDLAIKGQTTNHYILATVDSTSVDTTYPVGDNLNNDYQLAAGTLTLDKAADSPTSNYAVAESDVVLGKFTVKATGEEMEVRQVKLSIYNTSAATTALAGSYFLKSSGQTLYSAAFARSLFTQTATDADVSITLSTYLILKAGETKTVEIVGNIGSTATASDNYGANIDITQIKRLLTGDLLDPGVSVVNTSARSVKAATLDVTDVAMAASGTYKIVSGANSALVGKYVLNSSSGGEDARVNSLFVTLQQPQNGTAPAYTDWSNWRMYRVEDDGTETLLSTSNNTDAGAVTMTFTFTTPQVVAKSMSNGVTFVLRANFAGSGIAANEISRFVISTTGSDVVGNVTGNSVTETVVGAGTTIISATGGTLRIALDTAVAPAVNSLVNVGQADYTLGAVTLKAEDETQKITALQINIEGTAASSTDVTNVRVYLDGAATPLVSAVSMNQHTGWTSSNGGLVSWSSPDKLFEIEKDQTRKLKFVANIAGAGSARVGNDIRLDVDQTYHVTSTGKQTNTSASRSLLSNNGITHTIQPFSVVVSEASPAYPASNIQANVSTGTLLAKFKLLNNGPVSITTTRFKIFNNGACTFDSIGTSTCNAEATDYSLKSSAENSDSTSNLVSGIETNEYAGSITWMTFDNTMVEGTNVTIAGGRYRTLGVYISGTTDGYAAGSNWQFSVSTEGDVTFAVNESNLGYDADTDGISGVSDAIGNTSTTGLKARGKPSLPAVTDQTT